MTPLLSLLVTMFIKYIIEKNANPNDLRLTTPWPLTTETNIISSIVPGISISSCEKVYKYI